MQSSGSECIVDRVSKFSKNLFRENFKSDLKIIYFLKISTIFIIIFAKFLDQFSQKFKINFRQVKKLMSIFLLYMKMWADFIMQGVWLYFILVSNFISWVKTIAKAL